MNNEINPVFKNSVLEIVPATEAEALDSTALFQLAKFAEFKQDISTALSQLHDDKKVLRKKVDKHFVYWRAPLEQSTGISSYSDIVQKLQFNKINLDNLDDYEQSERLSAQTAATESATKASSLPMASLKPVTTYSLITSKGQIDQFKQVGDEWNGMMKLENPDGEIIIVAKTESDFRSAFLSTFEQILGFETEKQYAVIKCTPAIAAMFAGQSC